ncbi:MAG: hypothetical protein LBV23_02640 [Deltaproteobacteria bacterium]|nr:hypothetical protein [Deltaproteobacteria bacterium]
MTMVFLGWFTVIAIIYAAMGKPSPKITQGPTSSQNAALSPTKRAEPKENAFKDELADYALCPSRPTEGGGLIKNMIGHYDSLGRYVILMDVDGRVGSSHIDQWLSLSRNDVTFVDFTGEYNFDKPIFRESASGPIDHARLGKHQGYLRLSLNYREGRAPKKAAVELRCRYGALAVRYYFNELAKNFKPIEAPEIDYNIRPKGTSLAQSSLGAPPPLAPPPLAKTQDGLSLPSLANREGQSTTSSRASPEGAHSGTSNAAHPPGIERPNNQIDPNFISPSEAENYLSTFSPCPGQKTKGAGLIKNLKAFYDSKGRLIIVSKIEKFFGAYEVNTHLNSPENFSQIDLPGNFKLTEAYLKPPIGPVAEARLNLLATGARLNLIYQNQANIKKVMIESLCKKEEVAFVVSFSPLPALLSADSHQISNSSILDSPSSKLVDSEDTQKQGLRKDNVNQPPMASKEGHNSQLNSGESLSGIGPDKSQDELLGYKICHGTGLGPGQGRFLSINSHYDSLGRLVLIIPFEGQINDFTPVFNQLKSHSVTYIDFAGTYSFKTESLKIKDGPPFLARFGRHKGFVRLSLTYRPQKRPKKVELETLCSDNTLVLRYTFDSISEPSKEINGPKASLENTNLEPLLLNIAPALKASLNSNSEPLSLDSSSPLPDGLSQKHNENKGQMAIKPKSNLKESLNLSSSKSPGEEIIPLPLELNHSVSNPQNGPTLKHKSKGPSIPPIRP